MKGATTDTTTSSIAIAAARAADDKKATDTLVLDVGDILAITEYFVITSASNSRLARTVVDEVEKQLKEQFGVAPRSVEGLDDARWILLDYGDLVVHVFLDEAREYYALDRLWGDAPSLDWQVVAPKSATG
ncbi:MAG: ribosome silencing factor [Acidimicrobiia bacterium]